MGVYRPRHPERTVLYRVLFHNFDRFLTEFESRFEKERGFLRPIIKEVVERLLDCGNPRCGFARILCPDCSAEHLLMFFCRTRGFYPSCHAKRLEEWGEWMRGELLLDVPHRQVVFTIPKMIRPFFKFKRRLLGELCQAAVQTLLKYFQAETGVELMPGVVAVIQLFRKVYEVNPLTCPKCGGLMKVISFLTDYPAVDRIIHHLNLTFVAERPPPPYIAYQKVLTAAETPAEYSS